MITILKTKNFEILAEPYEEVDPSMYQPKAISGKLDIKLTPYGKEYFTNLPNKKTAEVKFEGPINRKMYKLGAIVEFTCFNNPFKFKVVRRSWKRNTVYLIEAQ